MERGPWHYGADYIAVYFEADPDSLRGLLPSQFDPEPGPSIAYICEIVSVGEAGAGMVATRPDRTTYHEAAVGIRCSFREKKGVFYPIMWVTTEWSLLRGILNGYQKRLADRIAMTKLHPLNPGLGPVAVGTELGGFCVKGPETTLSLRVRVGRVGSPNDLQTFGSTFGMRRFPGTDPSQSSLEEPVEISKSGTVVSDVWVGSGSVATSLDIGGLRPVSGAIYRSGFTISGSVALR